MKKKKTNPEVEELRLIHKMRAKGKSYAEIALKLNRSVHYVMTRCNRLYYPKKLRELVKE